MQECNGVKSVHRSTWTGREREKTENGPRAEGTEHREDTRGRGCGCRRVSVQSNVASDGLCGGVSVRGV